MLTEKRNKAPWSPQTIVKGELRKFPRDPAGYLLLLAYHQRSHQARSAKGRVYIVFTVCGSFVQCSCVASRG